MAEKLVYANGGSGSGWAAGGTATNQWDGLDNTIAALDTADYTVITGTTEDVVLTLDLGTHGLVDGDTLTNVSIKVHGAGADADDIPTVANPVRFSATPVSYRHAPPQLGQHTDEILSQELKYSDEQIAALRRSGAI